MSRSFDPELDLTISRVIKAPRAAVWRAWADPNSLEQWWVPAPAKARVVKMDLRPGGAFETEYAENGVDFVSMGRGCFLAVDKEERIVFTDALKDDWRPNDKPFMTAIIAFKDHPDGTDYSAHVMHKSQADRKKHEEMGFHDGWGTVIEQLARMAEGR